MGFFTPGNLLTLGIVVLVLIMYRQLDRRSRSLDKLSKYAEKLKGDLKNFADEKSEEVRGYGIDLKVEKESGKELMNRIRVTNEDLAEKAEAVNRIEERLKVYGGSLEELTSMTARVQENLSRLRDEAAFVDGANRRVAEAKSGLEALEAALGGLEIRFERDNAESLEKTAESVIASVKSTVSDLAAAAETIERKVEEHREAVNKTETERETSLARDMALVNKTLSNAVEQAALRADRMEEAALVKLKDHAQERVRRLQTAEEERLKTYQESAKTRVAEIQNLIKTFKDEWRAEKQELDSGGKAFMDEWKKQLQEIKTGVSAAGKEAASSAGDLEKTLEALRVKTAKTVADQEAFLLKAAEEMKQKILEASGKKLEEYGEVQEGEFKRLESLIEDSRKLDGELRRNMQETVSKVKEDFSSFEQESASARKAASAEFARTLSELRSGMGEVEKELSDLKSSAYENVSDKLKGFEDEFITDLKKRGADLDRRVSEWQDVLEKRLSDIGNEAAAERRELEARLGGEIKKGISSHNERVLLELENLKAETGAFEEAIRGRINTADESLDAYREQLVHNLEEARQNAEYSIKAEMGNYTLSVTEKIKQNQRELDERLREISDYVEAKNNSLSALIDASRGNIAGLDGKVASIRASFDEAYEDAESRRSEIIGRTEEQAKSLEAGIREAERHIKEFFDQTRLIGEANEVKAEMERRIEDLRSDIDRLDQRRIEAAQMESEFAKIRRLGDEVNAKMARIASEKYRIDKMEADFNRLLQTSRAVEEKLVQVSASDDVLQETLVQIRRFDEALGSAEEKFQRLEKKGQILEVTTDSIDKNFKSLQEMEKTIKRAGEDIAKLVSEEITLKEAVGILAGENEKARETAERITVLDGALAEIAEKTKTMQVAREWLARTETRLEELNKQAQASLKLIEAAMSGGGGKKDAAPIGPGAPSIQKKESVIQLARQGWKKEAIAKNMQLSLGEVEMILETFYKT